MKELFIKCPSCGAVLQVKNSKNEAVKQIACPNCKHRLAVSFEESPQKKSSTVPQPLGSLYYGEMPIPLQEGINKTQFPGSQHVELNVVRLADGGSKCIIKATGAEEIVTVNGETLQKDDQVVLAKGDKLEIGHVLLYFEKPCSLPDNGKKSGETRTTPLPPPSSHKSNNWLLYVVGGMITFALVLFLMWPKSQKDQEKYPDNDTAIVESHKKEPQKPKETVVKDDDGKKDIVKDDTPKTPNYRAKSDYDLEKLASHGDVKAQFELGNRLVGKGGSINIVLGLNYLRMASKKGSADAKEIWQKHVNQIKRRAEQGDSVAYDILMKID